jgi:hypothetical protein
MPWTQEGFTAVIAAQRFNVTAAREHWFIKHRIIDEGDLLEGSLFSDAVVQARTSRFQFLLLPDQLQFVPTVTEEQEQSVIVEKLGGIVKQLPHVPYKGIGLNFVWHLMPKDGDTNRVTRELFYLSDRPLYREFSGADARFGGYLSKDHNGFRLKLHVSPIAALTAEGGAEQRVQFSFNFHCDLGEDGWEEIPLKLSHWNGFRAEAERITDIVEKRG